MKETLLGFKPTAWMSIIIILGMTAMYMMGKIQNEAYLAIVKWVFGISAGKTTVVEAVTALKNGKSKE